MAATLTSDNELTYASFPIEKIETTPDGDVLVWGKATDGSVDSDEQIVDPEFAAKALPEWKDTGGNVRVQHQAQRDPAGVGVSVERDGDAHWVKSLIVEPVAKRLVNAGALRAYSVGIARPTIVRDASARGGRITDGQIVEISLVDRPANKNCGIQLVKADKTGQLEWIGKVWGAEDILTKQDATEDVTLTLPADVSVGFSPKDLARIVGRRQNGFIGKDVSTVSHGGVPAGSMPKCDDDMDEDDVEKGKLTTDARNDLPDSAFVFPETRKYPIHDKNHARNALSRVAANGTPEEKAKVRAAVARRYPGIGKKLDKADAKAAAKAAATVANEAKPEMTKPAEKKEKAACMSCGAMQNTVHKFCSECGKAMDGSMPVEKNHDFMCLGCGKKLDKGEQYCPECGKENPGFNPMADQKVPANAEKKSKAKIKIKPETDDDGSRVEAAAMAAKTRKKGKGKPFGGAQAPPFGKDKDGDGDADDAKKTADAPVTSVKGKKLPGKTSSAITVSTDAPGRRGKAKKAKVPSMSQTPGAGTEAAPEHPVPGHREGDANQEFNRDMGKSTAPPEVGRALRLKSLGIADDMGYAHDLVCPAYSWEDVAKCYPSGLDAFSADDWQQKALTAAASAPLAEAQAASQLGQHAFTIKSAALTDVIDVKNDINKAFRDANPGPGSAPSPGEVCATHFHRPRITEGHAAYSHQYQGPNTASVPSGSLSASSFGRGYVDAGRAQESPANKSGAPYPSETGVHMNLDYSSIHKTNVFQAFAAMHDHFDRVFPGVCPMNNTGTPAHHLDAVKSDQPEVVKKVSRDGMTGKQRKKLEKKLTRRVMKGKMPLDEARIKMGKKPKTSPEPLSPHKGEAAPEITKAAVTDGQNIAKTVAAALRKSAKKQDKEISALKKMVLALADQPDPGTQPFKGMALTNPVRKSATPAGVAEIADNAARTQLMIMRELENEARNSPYPERREAAWNAVLKMKGLDGLTDLSK